MSQQKKENSTAKSRALTIVGVVLCVVLIPILAVNITLIIKSYTNTDEVPKIGGYCPLIVLTGSMEPEIASGDLIICKQIDGEQVKVDDVIAFFDPEGNGTSIITHRVVRVVNENGSLSFQTKGDANNTADAQLVSADKLVGIYQFKISGAGNVAMFMQTPAGLVICVVLPLALIIGYDIIRRRRYEKKNQQDTDALLAELNELKAQKAEQQTDDNLE
ncbi:MAG: signal peptidase I [Ruminococcus sp.]|nr:signal peptidase I [Ruminococcus sp.]